jgi:hypothetical protein
MQRPIIHALRNWAEGLNPSLLQRRLLDLMKATNPDSVNQPLFRNAAAAVDLNNGAKHVNLHLPAAAVVFRHTLY